MLPAILLTAGLGTRLDPLTRLVAKPAVPVGQRTLIEHVLQWLHQQDISEAVLNLHHRPETITSVLGDGAHLGLRLRYSWEDPILGSAGGPARALSLLRAERAVIVNGDTLCRVDLAAMLRAHEGSGADVTLAVMPNPSPDHYNGLVIDEDRCVSGVIPKGRATAETWHFVGVQIVEAGVFSRLADGVPAETMAGIYLDMIGKHIGSVRGWPIAVPFIDVGTPRDYLRVALSHTAVAPPPRLLGSIVWPEARVPADAELLDCIVAGPVAVPAGFRAARSVLVPSSVLRPDERVPTAGQAAVFPLD